MLYVICYLIAIFACSIGTICGMGGGIIIKPVLDATGMMNISTITFLSGCTVIAMSLWSVLKTFIKKESMIDLRNTTILAIGAAIGGLSGKQLYQFVASLLPNANMAGGIQAILLFIATFATLIYTIKKDHIKSKQLNNLCIIFLVGFILGNLGSFLGIGGGPFNIAMLFYFFSMPTKKAAQNSLYIVLFSQVTSIGKTIISNGIPDLSLWIFIGMIVFGILGSEIGRKINKKIDDRYATRLFEAVMCLIMCINIYNIIKYFILV